MKLQSRCEAEVTHKLKKRRSRRKIRYKKIKEAESGNSTVPEKEKDARSLVRSNPFWEQLRSIVFCEYDPFP
ncbi:hypothetical protein NC653_041057 [Populus alba x Populus x berolinensis]|uniref:Uncharacterized protein n=1 Tax=Populus alba x Populus x berolinensis TaxID=444605 RepID=A0AAD6PPG9_9ROSI|nr:hypothetical protein NC653_041057 [Populus alba x Populus x berolinensis]